MSSRFCPKQGVLFPEPVSPPELCPQKADLLPSSGGNPSFSLISYPNQPSTPGQFYLQNDRSTFRFSPGPCTATCTNAGHQCSLVSGAHSAFFTPLFPKITQQSSYNSWNKDKVSSLAYKPWVTWYPSFPSLSLQCLPSTAGPLHKLSLSLKCFSLLS